MYLQIAQSTGSAAGAGGGDLVGVVLGSPSVLPPQAPADPPAVGQPMPIPHQLRIQQWWRAPPQQWPWGLPATITILTPDLLTGPEAAEGHRRLLVEVGVGFDFWVKRKGRAHVFSQLLLFVFHLPTCFTVVSSESQRAGGGSVWSSATSSTGVRGPPVRSCSSG